MLLLPRPSPGDRYLYPFLSLVPHWQFVWLLHPVPGPPSAVWTFLPSTQLYPALSELATYVRQTFITSKSKIVHTYII